MTSTQFTCGAVWGTSSLYDGWGDNATAEQAEALGDLVVSRFDELAKRTGSTVFWQPATSEVIGEVLGEGPNMWKEKRKDGKETTDEQMTEWREQATSEVWAALIGDPAPRKIRKAVAKIFK